MKFFHRSLLLLALFSGANRVCAQGQAAPQAPAPPTDFAPPEMPFDPTAATPAERAQWNELRARVSALETRYNTNLAPGFPANRALLKFKLDQARLWLGFYDADLLLDPASALNYAKATMARAEFVSDATTDATWAVAQRVFPQPKVRPQIHERAYFAPDGSSQPFWIYLPSNYSPRKKYPLVVMLHGYTPDISKIQPWLPGPDGWLPAVHRDMILLVTYGRRNSDFVGVGEDDTYTARREAEKYYSTDPNRAALFGVSMGGTGALVEAMHRPGAWCGVAAMSARTDLYAWAKLNRADVPAWKQPLYDADNPIALAANLRGTPLLIMHGERDAVVPVMHPRRLVSTLRQKSVAVDYREVPRGAHTSYLEATHLNTVWTWLAALKPLSPPRSIRFVSHSPANNRAHWAQINAFSRDDRPATLNVQLSPGQLNVQSGNVRAFTLSPPASLLGAQPVALRVNGVDAGTFAPGTPIHWPQADAANAATPPDTSVNVTANATMNAWPGLKTLERVGPIKNVYRAPFLIVYGETNEADARRFATEWDAFADGMPSLKRDTQITSDDKTKFNLVLFGTRDTNTLLREIADKLPIELLSSRSVRVNRETRTFTNVAGTLGVQLCYPSPWSAGRMIVVQSGRAWGGALPANHKWDFLPDYLVYDGAIDQSDLTNRALIAGWFSHEWQLAP